MRRFAFFVPLAIAAVLFGLLAQALWRGEGPTYRPSAMLGEKAPRMALPALAIDGKDLTLGEPSESPVAINFFASWCVPCRAEHPVLKQLAAMNGVRLIGIAYKDRPEDARAFLHELGDPFAATGLDQDGKAAIAFGVTGVPETFILDRQGVIRHHVAGPLTTKTLESEVASSVAQWQ